MNEKMAFISPLPDQLTAQFRPTNFLEIETVNLAIEALNEFAGRLPPRYHWRFRTVEAIAAEMNEAQPRTALTLNRIYWQDTLKTCEAYTVMATWRIVDLARNCSSALGRDDYLSATILARSALEATAQFFHSTQTITEALEAIARADFSTHMIAATELEELLLKTVFASRLPTMETFYNPTNILTILRHVSKVKGQEFVQPIHEILSEFTHPNFLGRSLYILDVTPNGRAGDETRTLGLGKGIPANQGAHAVLRALSWACMTHVTSALPLQNSIRLVAKALAV
jgi:hypothetical protein